jgi:uncharacterized protein with PIN domain
MQIKFHLDEHIPTALAKALRRHGFDVTTTHDANLLGREDGDQLAFAVAAGRVLVTKDDDFTRPLNLGATHCGVCYCHPDKYSLGEIIEAVLLVAECASAEEMQNRVEFL